MGQETQAGNRPPSARRAAQEKSVAGGEYRLFKALDKQQNGTIKRWELERVFARMGLSEDPRLASCRQSLARFDDDELINYADFANIIGPNIQLVEQALQGNMVIPDFDVFCQDIEKIYHQSRDDRSGDVAQYIPQLARVDPEQYGLSVCTIDGQRFAIGDADVEFCVQSCSKPLTYCMALEEHGEDTVHRYIGREPSGRSFNELILNVEKRPHNPLINSGAIMACSLIRPDKGVAARFDHVMKTWQALSGSEKAGFNNSVYLSERQHADRNFALGYTMRENKAFPEGTDLLETLEFYFQCCSIELTARQMSVVAGTLANGGVCPVNGNRVFKTETVRSCLSLMYSCGMYDFSGEFAFTIGLPAKSGVAGALLIVIPNVMGICTWSPRLDTLGNSVRGVAFCKELINTFNFHNYDKLRGLNRKKDPRFKAVQLRAEQVNMLICLASKGDLGAIQRLSAEGVALDCTDYDLRTPLHLAAAEGQTAIVSYFIDQDINLNPLDRWGQTPLDDAYCYDHTDVITVLESHKAKRSERDDTRSHGALELQEHPVRGASGKTMELIWSSYEGDLRAIQRLVARGAQLDRKDYDHRTALHLAASEGHGAIVDYLLAHKVDVNPRDRWGATPLDDAKRHDHADIIKTLEQSGGTGR
jgi:glutaminase